MKKLQILTILAFAPALFAQFPGGPPPGPPKPAKDIGPIDLTGYWVSIVTEDWRFRMIAAPKGDWAGVPLNPAGQKIAKEWDPAKDDAAGNQCKAYGAAGLMRMPTRLHITWAGRQHAEDRDRCRDANAIVALRSAATSQRSCHVAGLFRRALARTGWRCRIFRSGVRSNQRRLARSEHQPSCARLSSPQWRTVQRQDHGPGILRRDQGAGGQLDRGEDHRLRSARICSAP